MTRTMNEMILAAKMVEGELIGGNGTEGEIRAALEKACPGWAEQEWREAARLAVHAMHRVGDEAWNDADLGIIDIDETDDHRNYGIHLVQLSGDLQSYVEQRSAALPADFTWICDRYVTTPVPERYRKPQWGELFHRAMAEDREELVATICYYVEGETNDAKVRAERWKEVLERAQANPGIEHVLKEIAATRGVTT